MSNAFDPKTAKPVTASNKSGDAFDPSTATSIAEPDSPGLIRHAADSAVALGSGVTQGVKMLTDVAGADNAASHVLGKATDALTDLSSPYAKAKKQERAAKIKAAEDSGSTWEEVKAYAGSFADAPLDTTLNALGTSAPTLAVGLLTGGAGALPAVAARAAQVGLGVAQGVGGIKGQIHESVKQKHLDAGASEADASQRADAAQAYTGPNAASIALGGALGGVAGSTGAESAVRRLAGQRVAAEAAEKAAPGVLRSTAAGAAKEAPMEMLQGGQERHASNTALQGEGFDVPTWQGVAGQAALEGLASAPMGGGFGAMEGMAHKGAAQRQSEGATAFTAGDSRTPPDSIKSVLAKAQWVRGWDAAQAQQQEIAAGSGPAAESANWTTAPGAASLDVGESGTAVASPANAPNLDYETLPGAAPEAAGNGIDFARDFAAPDWGTEAGAGTGIEPAVKAPPVAPDLQLTPSQAMGLDPNAGALSKVAAMAVDTGATASLSAPVEQAPAVGTLTGAAQAMAPQEGAPSPAAAPGVDPDTGEISLQAQMNDLRASIGYMQQQGKAQGWSKDMVAQRNALQSQLTKLEVQSAAGQAQGASTTGAPAPAQLSGITQILAKQVPDMSEQELQQAIAHYGPNHKRTAKLEKALQALAQQTLTAIETGANANVSQASQAQQGSAQPAQATRAQATASGPSAIGEAARIAKEGNAQREQDRQRQLDASERWMRMTTVERQAAATNATGLNPIQKKNLHTKAWADLSEKTRASLVPVVVPATTEQSSAVQAPAAVKESLTPQAAAAPAVTAAASEAATSNANDRPAPTEAQIEAGNYKKGHVRLNGHEIAIENPAGTKRRPEWPALQNHYGYIKGSMGADKDHVDLFMTDRAEDASLPVFVVDQNNRDGTFDEHKVIMGAANEAEARSTYLGNYAKGWGGLGAITQMTQDEFKAWVKDPAKTKRRAAPANQTPVKQESSASTGSAPVKAAPVNRPVPAKFAYIEPAQALVQQEMRGEITREQLRQGFADLDMSSGAVRSVTNPIEWRQADDEAVQALRNKTAEPSPNTDALNDRDHFTLERMNHATGEMEPVTFERGETVKVSGGAKPYKTGVITSISHADRQFKVDGSKYGADFGYANKADYDEFAVPRAEVDEALDGLAKRLDSENASDAQATIDRARKIIERHNLGDYAKARMAELSAKAANVSKSVIDKMKAATARKDAEEAQKRADELAAKKPLPDVVMTMDEWKAVHKDAKITIDGQRMVLREGGMRKVVIDKPKSIPAKMREAMAARADYFTPGNIVKGYSGHDRVIAYTTRDSHGGWSVTVQAVRKQGDGWVNEANEGPRTHTTQPTARDLKAGPVERGIDVLGREDELPFSRSTLEAPQTDQEKALVLQGAPVAEVDTAIAPMGAPAIRSWATDLFEQQGGKAHNPALGDVMLDGRSVRSSLAHGRPNAHKVAAFAAVKDVLEKGAVVLSARHGRDGDSFYVSAPVKVGGAINIVTVLVKRDPNDQRMYLHSVATKEYLLNRRVSRTDTTSGVERSGSNDSGDASTLAKQRDVGKASTEEVADELHRLLTLNAGERADNASTTARFRREAADTATGADFDVASFLQIMNEGQPASAAAAAAPAMNVRPSYSSAARAEAVRAVTGTADAIRQAWANGPEVIVAFDMQDPVVPESARRADLKQRSGGARGAPEGFYYQGKVYLMASKLKTPNDAARVLFHEALGHHGLRGLFGKELGQILNQVANMREKEVDAKISEYGLRGVSKLDRRTAAEEVLAEMAQSTPQIGFVRRAVAAIRTWLRTHVPGFKSLALTDAELIRNYILPARAWVENGGAAGNLNGVASFSRDSREAPQTDLEKALVLQGAPVAVLDLKNAPSGGYAVVERWAADLFAQQGGKAISPEFGEVVLDARSAKSSVAHGGANDAKKVAFAAVKDVIERGALVYRTTAGNTDSFYSSAPVSISGKDNIVTVLVRRDHNTQRMYLHSVSLKENLLKPRVSSVDANKASERSGSTSSGEVSTLANGVQQGKVATEDVARELNRLLTLDTSSTQDGAGEPMFSRSRFMDLKDSALDQLSQTFTHEGKVSLWDKSVGTMRHLGERAPAFKPVYEAASQNIEDVSMLANDAADAAPRLIPRVESLRDMLGKDRKKPVSAADNKAVGKPLFEGTLIWGRDENGKATLVEDLQKRHANLSVHNKAAMLLKQGKIDSGVLAMWQGKPLEQFEKLIDSRFESVFLKPGIVWSDTELQSLFGANANQISLYREARAAIDRSIDMTARTDMLRVVGEKYEAMRDAVLGQPSVEAAAQLLLDTLEQDAKADPDSRDRLGEYMQQIKRRMETATDLQKAGYAPLSRFGRYTVDVVDANGERQYFGMYETARDSNLAKMQLAQEFKGATITTGTMSAQAYKLFAGVTPETLEQFGEMLGLKSEGNEAQDKAFQEFLKLTKNNHSAMKRMIHRQGIAGFSQDVGRVVANFVYSNARAGAMGLNAGKMDTAIGAIPKEQGELKDLAMGLRSYIRDPQEEGQAVRGMLFAQYLGGSLASAFVNMTQPFQITMPWLSQYGGMKKAGTQMARALKDMGTKGFQYEADLAKALQAAEDDGTVSPQEVHQLMAQARGAGGLRSGDGTRTGDARAQASNLWEKGKVLWGQPFALAEQFNRRSTFIASYRIAKEQGMVDPAGFARKAVLETQFVYSKANKPKWARGAVGGTLFTFKTYSVSYLELMQRMWTQGGPEGKRAVGWALAMLVLMGGAGGLPFMEDAEDLIDGAGQLMGYNLSSKQWRKELMADAVGKELADFMEQGISGLPGAPIDVSGRLGMGNLLPGTGLFLEKPNRERDLTEIVGPVGDLVTRGFSGARDVIKGVLTGDAATAGKGVLEWTPTAVRNAFKGADMATSGMYKDGKGYKVIDTTLAEAAAKAIGFQPKSVAEVQEANSFMQRSKSFYTQTSSEIKAQWADALFRKDEAAVKRVRERLADWNRDNPEQPIVVKMPDVWKKVREMGKARSDRIADTAPKALRAQMREEAAALRS